MDNTTPLSWGKGWTPKHTTEDLNDTALAAQAGDQLAKERLVVMMRPYLVNFLRKIPGDYTPDQREEMTAAALLGLWEAVKRYDPSKQATSGKQKFSNYALNWVRHEVMEWRAKNSRSLPVPRKAWNFLRKVEAAWLEENPGGDISTATDEELASIEIAVMRGKPGSSTKGSHRGEKEVKVINVPYAGDIVRGMRQPFLLDPEHEPEAGASAEDIFFGANTVAEESIVLGIAELMAASLLELPEDERDQAAESFAEEIGWPPEAAEVLLDMMKGLDL